MLSFKPILAILIAHLFISRNYAVEENSVSLSNSLCRGTLYQDLCSSTLSSFQDLSSKSLQQIVLESVNYTTSEVRAAFSNCSSINKKRKAVDPIEKAAIYDCLELLDITIDDLYAVLSNLSPGKPASNYLDLLQTFLSAAMTNQYTCLDGFSHSRGRVREGIKKLLHRVIHHVSNNLFLLKKIPRGKKGKGKGKTEIFPVYGRMKKGFPSWVSTKDRKLLQLSVNETTFDLIVAKDGTGNFTTIGDAVAAAPNASTTRFVIYIKAGAYFENVEVDKTKTNLMFLGDGIGKTVVKASRSVVDNSTTFRSATVAAVGNGFIAKGMTFENSAGAIKHQAVAFRSGADLSAFYNCSFVAYQDTLYVHSLRQFYRECDIYGTIDFIFGNAAVVFQNCNLYARKPLENQSNIFTAQGRQDPNQNTGISIINCKVAAAADLIPVQSNFQTYLGRPWKEYSRTVYLQSNLGDLIDPAGWLEWNGTFALNTLFYREFKNRGPGSNTSARVQWPGYKVLTNATEAMAFTVSQFIQGTEWLNSTGIPYFPSLK